MCLPPNRIQGLARQRGIKYTGETLRIRGVGDTTRKLSVV
jgi:hypothetical protein